MTALTLLLEPRRSPDVLAAKLWLPGEAAWTRWVSEGHTSCWHR